ncbi:MAG: PAS domain S-box protein [Gammaproteobacteria bacterium]
MNSAAGDGDAGLEARYRGVIEATVDGVIIIDEHGRIETFNSAAERIFGYEAAEVRGHNVALLMPKHDATRHDGYMHRYLAGGEPRIIGIGRQVFGRRKSGEVFPLELGVGEIEGLTPRRFIGTVRDITRRRQLEDALAAREQELTQVLDHAPIGIFAAASSGRLVQVNPAFCALTGYDANALPNTTVSDLTLPDDRDALREAYVEVFEGVVPACQCRLRWMHRDGSTIHVELHVATVTAGTPLVIGQVLDRTEQVRSERESRDIGARLAHAGRVSTLGEMASAIAHEINQPLTAISAFAQATRRLLDRGAPDLEMLRETLDSIGAQALRAGDVVRRIRGFVSNRDSARVASDLNEIVAAALEFADFDLRAHEVSVATRYAAGLPAVVVDPLQVQQVCLNLVRNAIDAMDAQPPATRRLEIVTSGGSHGVVLRCTDSGPGVPADMRARLFQPFQTTKAEGMGMGLSISASIVTAHGGRLRYADEAADGACFVMELPAALE